MAKILLLGAGKSATVLIEELAKWEANGRIKLTLCDPNYEQLKPQFEQIIQNSIQWNDLDVTNEKALSKIIMANDLVISMVPARFHPIVARWCLHHRCHLITPSYTSQDMKDMHDKVKANDLIFINEMGLDPGIDHMSAMEMLDDLRSEGGKITGFRSFTGGLVAPESDTNPWHYKFTWNPRNVILAGQGPAVAFKQEGRLKYIPYHKLFDRTELIDIEGYGAFEGYANRDSLSYRSIYGLEDIDTMYRGTFRRPPFCSGWHMLVQLGMTDDSYEMLIEEGMTYRDFTNLFLKYRDYDSVELKMAHYLDKKVNSEPMQLLEWLGLFSDQLVQRKKASPARILQDLLEDKWRLEHEDKDMIVMWHDVRYTKENTGEVEQRMTSSLVVIGEDQMRTAMAKTVGLPIVIAAKLIIDNQLMERGVLMPTLSSIYKPSLQYLESKGISFNHKVE